MQLTSEVSFTELGLAWSESVFVKRSAHGVKFLDPDMLPPAGLPDRNLAHESSRVKYHTRCDCDRKLV